MNKLLNQLLLICFLALPSFAQKQKKKKQTDTQLIYNKLSESNKSFLSGFVLKDLQNGSTVFALNENKRFVLGSNTKIFTLLGGLNILKDSIATYQYAIKGDSLIILPMGDPTFLHSDFKDQPAFDLLKNSSKNIYLLNGRYKGQKFGKNWAWDNFDNGAQMEVTDFPIYGNSISFEVLPNGKFLICPDLANMFFSENHVSGNGKRIRRSADSNNLYIPSGLNPGYKQSIPLILDAQLQAGLLSDTLLASGFSTTSVTAISKTKPLTKLHIAYNAKAQDVYEALLRHNESLFGEQLLLNYCATLGKPLSIGTGIEESSKHFSFDKTALSWQDGSGLSGKNMSSPNIVISALEQIRNKINNQDILFHIFKRGNISVSNIHAQVGNLINTYNVSGYITGASGKKYVFSFLNNNVNDIDDARNYVNEILQFIQEHY